MFQVVNIVHNIVAMVFGADLVSHIRPAKQGAEPKVTLETEFLEE
jgi:hypothetical protein